MHLEGAIDTFTNYGQVLSEGAAQLNITVVSEKDQDATGGRHEKTRIEINLRRRGQSGRVLFEVFNEQCDWMILGPAVIRCPSSLSPYEWRALSGESGAR